MNPHLTLIPREALRSDPTLTRSLSLASTLKQRKALRSERERNEAAASRAQVPPRPPEVPVKDGVDDLLGGALESRLHGLMQARSVLEDRFQQVLRAQQPDGDGDEDDRAGEGKGP